MGQRDGAWKCNSGMEMRHNGMGMGMWHGDGTCEGRFIEMAHVMGLQIKNSLFKKNI